MATYINEIDNDDIVSIIGIDDDTKYCSDTNYSSDLNNSSRTINVQYIANKGSGNTTCGLRSRDYYDIDISTYSGDHNIHNGTNESYVANSNTCSNNDNDIMYGQYDNQNSISNNHYIDKSMCISSAAEYISEDDAYTNFRLELDSHNNMHVVGSGTYI